MEYRTEHDTMGEIRVPADRHWGAQTQRSLMNFPIGEDKMPRQLLSAFAILKKAAALANVRLGKLDEKRSGLMKGIGEAFQILYDSKPVDTRDNGSRHVTFSNK